MMLADMAARRLRDREVTKAKGDPEALRDVERVRRDGFGAFIRIAWPQLETAELLTNWHIDAIAEHLEAVTLGEIRRLIINVPPGCMKSLCVSVLWNAWVWTEDPSFRWIFASYSPALSRRDAIKVRNLIDSPWWRARWPSIEIPRQNTRSATDFANSVGGWRFSCGTSGVTGRHADVQVVDDPSQPQSLQNAGGVESASLDHVLRWWSHTMSMRLRDPKTSRRVIVMQRLHDRDLAGEMIREGGYEHLCLPMRFETERRAMTYTTNPETGDRSLFFTDPRTDEGELLFPARYPEAEVAKIEKDLGSQAAAAQLQQRPAVAGGTIFRRTWFRRYRELPPDIRTWIQSWDMRFKDDGKKGDFVVGQLWASTGVDHYLVKQVRGRWSFTESIRHLLALTADNPEALAKLIENKANGPAIASALERVVPGLILVEPHGGKVSRAHAVTPACEAGNVWIPEDEQAHPWVPEFLDEIVTFPNARFDDQVDCATQALHRLTNDSVAQYLAALERLNHG